MYINLDLQSDDPIYVQLKNQIIIGIAKKVIQPGDSLPSVRSLAGDLGINLHTVNKAYQQLKQEGFILIHRQKGVVINPEGISIADDAYRLQLKSSLKPILAEAVCRGMNEKEFSEISKQIFKEFINGEGEG